MAQVSDYIRVIVRDHLLSPEVAEAARKAGDQAETRAFINGARGRDELWPVRWKAAVEAALALSEPVSDLPVCPYSECSTEEDHSHGTDARYAPRVA
jgi:hypothetical protein